MTARRKANQGKRGDRGQILRSGVTLVSLGIFPAASICPERWFLLGWAALTLGGRFVRLAIDCPIEIAGALALSDRALLLVALILIVVHCRGANAADDGPSKGLDTPRLVGL
ncbi:MAG: hypothetical protein ACXW1Y_00230 [Acidimicrobiia bacterium]